MRHIHGVRPTQFVFKNIRVRPTHYTIRSSSENDKIDHFSQSSTPSLFYLINFYYK